MSHLDLCYQQPIFITLTLHSYTPHLSHNSPKGFQHFALFRVTIQYPVKLKK